MIINNKNEKISRNRKGRIKRKIEMDGEMKSILIKSKSEKNEKNF